MRLGTRQRRPSFIGTFAMIAATRLALRYLGFARSVAMVRRLAGDRAEASAAPAVVDSVMMQVISAAAFFPGRAECLEQSLVAYVLLRRRGVPAQLKLGVQPYPFHAHAWVELNGRAISEPDDYIAQFVPVEEFAL